jgi:ankyrin repeat protein
MTCPICLRELRGNTYTTNCKHEFHDSCIITYFSRVSTRKCPMCRQNVTMGKFQEQVILSLSRNNNGEFDMFNKCIDLLQRNQSKVFKYIIENNKPFDVDVNKETNGNTLLGFSLIMGLYSESKTLVENGAKYSNEIIMLASKHCPKFALWLLQEGRIKKNAHFLLYSIARQCMHSNELNVLKGILENSAHPKFIVNFIEENNSSNNLAFESVIHSEYNISKSILKYVYDINLHNKDGLTLLHVACAKNNYILVRELLFRGSSINTLSRVTRESTLTIACRHSSKHIIRMLLKENVFIYSENATGGTAFDIAGELYRFDICDMLIDYGFCINHSSRRSSFTPLMKAILSGNNKFIKYLLGKSNLLLNRVNRFGFDAVYLAYLHGSYESIKTLISSGVDINCVHGSRTLLIHSVFDDDYRMCRMLLKEGANPNIKDKWKKTALTYACERNRVSLIYLLLENGAEIEESLLQMCEEKAMNNVKSILLEC